MTRLKIAFLMMLVTPFGAQNFVNGEAPRFPIKEIRVNKNSVLSRRKVRRLNRKLLGQNAGQESLNLILRNVSNACVEKGFITSRAVIPPQSISSGVVQIHVLEGRLESLEFDEKSKSSWSVFDKTQLKTAFAGFKNQAINIRDIEQGLSQMNRLSSKNVTMRILPGSKEGFSKILLTNRGGRNQVRVRTSADNSGQESTGLYNARLSVEQDDLLKLNDTWSLNYSQSVKPAANEKQSQSFAANMSVPFGYWSVSASVAKSDYSTFIFGTNERIRNSGNGLQHSYKIDRSVIRGKNQTLSLWSQLSMKNNESYIEDVKSEVGSRKMTVIKCGASHNLTSLLGFINFTAAYNKGLNFMWARQDEDPLTPFTPRAQFEKFDASLSYYKPFRVMEKSVYFKSFVSGQYAFAPLYSSEQIAIGDAFSVRGFKERSGFGDRGFFATNDFGFSLPGFITEAWGINTALRKTEWFSGFDAGFVRHFGGKDANFGQGETFLTGWATGLRYNGGFLNGEITYAQSVHTEDFIGRSSEIYASMSLKWF